MADSEHLRRSPLKLACWLKQQGRLVRPGRPMQSWKKGHSKLSRQRQAIGKVLSQLKASLSKKLGLAAMKALLEDSAALIEGAKDATQGLET